VSRQTVREEGTSRPKMLPEPPVLHREKRTVRDGSADRPPRHGPSDTLVRTVRKLHAPKTHRQKGSKERRSRTRKNTKNGWAVRHLADGPRLPRGQSAATSRTVHQVQISTTEEHEKQPFVEVPSKRRSSKSNLIRRLSEGPIQATREGG
jgi:hypothetical protein